jgi:hypothetical protein
MLPTVGTLLREAVITTCLQLALRFTCRDAPIYPQLEA